MDFVLCFVRDFIILEFEIMTVETPEICIVHVEIRNKYFWLENSDGERRCKFSVSMRRYYYSGYYRNRIYGDCAVCSTFNVLRNLRPALFFFFF